MHPDRDRLIRTANALRVLVEKGFEPDDQVGNLRSYAAASVLVDDIERRVRRFAGWGPASEAVTELRGSIEEMVGIDVGHPYDQAFLFAYKDVSRLRDTIDRLGAEIPEEDDEVH